jgi:hypothetical protein
MAMASSGHPSREPSPVPQPSVLDAQAAERARAILRSLGRRIFVLLLATVFAVFSALLYGQPSDPEWRHNSLQFMEFAGRGLLLWLCPHILLQLFRDKGGRHIAETFYIALSFIAGIFFAMICPRVEFLEGLILCSILAIVFHYVH